MKTITHLVPTIPKPRPPSPPPQPPPFPPYGYPPCMYAPHPHCWPNKKSEDYWQYSNPRHEPPYSLPPIRYGPLHPFPAHAQPSNLTQLKPSSFLLTSVSGINPESSTFSIQPSTSATSETISLKPIIYKPSVYRSESAKASAIELTPDDNKSLLLPNQVTTRGDLADVAEEDDPLDQDELIDLNAQRDKDSLPIGVEPVRLMRPPKYGKEFVVAASGIMYLTAFA